MHVTGVQSTRRPMENLTLTLNLHVSPNPTPNPILILTLENELTVTHVTDTIVRKDERLTQTMPGILEQPSVGGSRCYYCRWLVTDEIKSSRSWTRHGRYTTDVTRHRVADSVWSPSRDLPTTAHLVPVTTRLVPKTC